MAKDNIDEVRDEIIDYDSIEETNSKGQEIILEVNNLSILTRLESENTDDIIDVPSTNIIYDYLNELKSVALKVELSDEEMLRYKYRPDLLSYDLYGTTSYEFVILALNSIISPKYFTKKVIYVIQSENIEDIMTDIYNAELDYIEYNRSTYDVKE